MESRIKAEEIDEEVSQDRQNREATVGTDGAKNMADISESHGNSIMGYLEAFHLGRRESFLYGSGKIFLISGLLEDSGKKLNPLSIGDDLADNLISEPHALL